jgi:hypothetical protein
VEKEEIVPHLIDEILEVVQAEKSLKLVVRDNMAEWTPEGCICFQVLSEGV